MLRPLSTTDGGLDSRQDLSRNRPRSPSFLAVLGFAEAREGSDSRLRPFGRPASRCAEAQIPSKRERRVVREEGVLAARSLSRGRPAAAARHVSVGGGDPPHPPAARYARWPSAPAG